MGSFSLSLDLSLDLYLSLTSASFGSVSLALFEYIPQAALAAIIITSVVQMVDLKVLHPRSHRLLPLRHSLAQSNLTPILTCQ